MFLIFRHGMLPEQSGLAPAIIKNPAAAHTQDSDDSDFDVD